MGQLDKHEAHVAHDRAAGIVHGWHDALHQVRANGEVDLYACGAARAHEQVLVV